MNDVVALFAWEGKGLPFGNFGDELSAVVVSALLGRDIKRWDPGEDHGGKRMLAIGSILHYARDGDIIWGTGVNGNHADGREYNFSDVDIRAVRGPLTRRFVREELKLECPEVYGDPALLLPYCLPGKKRRRSPEHKYVIIPHFSERMLFDYHAPHVVVPGYTPWPIILDAILNTELVIGSSLHGLIVAEAFQVPARMLRISERESLFKYGDYYAGTGRANFKCAESLEEAMKLGGESAPRYDARALREAFPRVSTNEYCIN